MHTESSLSDLKTSLLKSVSLVICTSAEEVIDSVSEVKLALTSEEIDATNTGFHLLFACTSISRKRAETGITSFIT